MTHRKRTSASSTVRSQAIARWVARHVAAAPVAAAMRDRRFRVAFSFPGELNPLLTGVVDALKAHVPLVEIFSYPLYEAELAIIDLDLYLQRTFGEPSELVVAFLCAEYDAKLWRRVE